MPNDGREESPRMGGSEEESGWEPRAPRVSVTILCTRASINKFKRIAKKHFPYIILKKFLDHDTQKIFIPIILNILRFFVLWSALLPHSHIMYTYTSMNAAGKKPRN